MKFSIRLVRLFLVLGALLTISARAGDLFQIIAETTDGSNIRIVSGGHSLVDLTQELLNNNNPYGPFASLSGHSYNATLSYGGVPNVLNFSVSQSITFYTAQLMSGPIAPGVVYRSFQATSQSALDSQIVNYLKSDGSGDLTKLLSAINKNSPAAVTDGNPHAATARNSELSFYQYAFGPTETAEETDASESSSGANADTSSSEVALMADGGQFDSKGIRGDTYSLAPMVPFKLTDRVRLEVTVPLEYSSIEGATEFGIGLQIALPVLIIKHTKDEPFSWQLTPIVGTLVSASEDLLSGGVLVDGGMASYSSYRCGKWQFSMGNAIMAYEGVRVQIGDYTFDPGVSQQIVKNGLKIGRQLGRKWFAEAYAIDTEFLQAAFTPRYTTIGAGIGYRGIKKKGYLMLGVYTDFAPAYTSEKLQFGTGWKF